MLIRKTCCFSFIFIVLLVWTALPSAAEPPAAPEKEKKPAISLPDDVGTKIVQRAASVKTEIANRASSLFEREPIGWDWRTIEYLYELALRLPRKLPEFIDQVLEQSRVLGVVGSCIVFIFLAAVFYSLLGRKRIIARIESKVQPLREKMPQTVYPFFLSALKVLVSALIPLVLLGLFSLINAMIRYQAAWFQLTGKLMLLWAVGSLIVSLLRESLTQDLFQAASRYGNRIFQLARLAVLYGLIGFAAIQAAAALQVRSDVIALLKFAIAVSLVGILFLFHLMKTALLSFLPDLPYPPYKVFVRILSRFYYPIIVLSFITALLWCIGYKNLGRVVILKLWSSGGVFLVIIMVYHKLRTLLRKWYAARDVSDEAAQLLYRSLRTMLLYAAILATVGVVLNLLGLLDLVERVVSFPVVELAATRVTMWLILKAVLILLAFIYAARLLQAYLDYKIYPSLGIDPGLGYALDTTFKYTLIAIGVLISLKVVGLDLRFLLVFAGAAGIGIGLGLQHLAANVISGFTIIFGGKIRKGDWIELEKGLGTVTDIYLRATKIRTRDNIEYLIPNSNLISNTIVNYSLSSPMIRIDLPLGVSYSADPRQVKQILLEAAEKEPMVAKFKKPAVRFVQYGDSSINFELLIWMDVRKTARRAVRSALYFEIFEEFRKAGIEIPFPQRDIHIRSSAGQHYSKQIPNHNNQ